MDAVLKLPAREDQGETRRKLLFTPVLLMNASGTDI